jgi:hypothetical protein
MIADLVCGDCGKAFPNNRRLDRHSRRLAFRTKPFIFAVGQEDVIINLGNAYGAEHEDVYLAKVLDRYRSRRTHGKFYTVEIIDPNGHYSKDWVEPDVSEDRLCDSLNLYSAD